MRDELKQRILVTIECGSDDNAIFFSKTRSGNVVTVSKKDKE